MADSPEDFERLLERCRAQLNAITLTLPILEEEGGPNALPPPKPAELPHFFAASVAVAAPPAVAKPAARAPEPEPLPPPLEVRPLEPESEPSAPLERFEAVEEPPRRDPAQAAPPEPELETEPEPAPAPRYESSAPPAPKPPAATNDSPEDRLEEEPLRRSSLDLPSARKPDARAVEDELPEPPRPASVPSRAEKAELAWRRVRESRAAARRESPFGWGALGLVALVAAVGYGVWRLQGPPVDRVFNLEGGDAAALRPERSDLVVAAGTKLLDVSDAGRVVERSTLESPAASLSWNQSALWSVDGRSSAVVELPDGTKRSTTFTLNYVPQAVYSRGRYLWTLEGGTTIRQYLVSRSLVGVQLQPLDLYQLAGISADAIAVDDAEVLWVFDRTARRLCRLHKVGPALRPIDSASLAQWIGAAPVRALSVDDGFVWVLVGADGGRAALHRIQVGRLDWNGA